jgi:drug/metabolite transporter (DMT)-like permease
LHLAMLLVAFCWATNIVAGKEALRGFDPLALAQLRVLGAALVFVMVFAGSRKQRPRLTRREWMFMALLALNGVTLNQLCFIGGLARSSVAHASLIVALGPVMVLVLACLLHLEVLTLLKFAGMVISFCGVGILTLEKSGRSGAGHWTGDLLLVIGSAVFAYYTIQMKEVANRFDALTLNLLAFGMGGLMLIPFAAHALLEVNWTALPAPAWWGLAYMIVLGSVVPYLLFAVALTELSAARVAAFNYLQPVIASSLGIWLLSERLTREVVAGGVLILLGLYLTERERGEE